ncbi:hypothetical protein B0H17DRAFT_1244929 [Mycena rosella]|uniref:HAT C-terminal dimerisation domain-containing protein n=1 Tax=Mycena rosella TaxID=1033263 RepID=A0AAD7CZW8_MYCRO|nr:hypothetical protein B0H17DRAFT_1244929 [Mycena rosella]
MSSGDWEFVAKLTKGLAVLKQCTLEFSKKTAPTITKVLPLYKLMEVALTELGTEHEFDEPALSTALLAGTRVATKYISNVLLGHYVLLGAESAHNSTPSTSIFAMPMALEATPASKTVAPAVDGKDEVNLYCGNISPVAASFDDPLAWWKENAGTLKYMARVARDILALPGIRYGVARVNMIWIRVRYDTPTPFGVSYLYLASTIQDPLIIDKADARSAEAVSGTGVTNMTNPASWYSYLQPYSIRLPYIRPRVTL